MERLCFDEAVYAVATGTGLRRRSLKALHENNLRIVAVYAIGEILAQLIEAESLEAARTVARWVLANEDLWPRLPR